MREIARSLSQMNAELRALAELAETVSAPPQRSTPRARDRSAASLRETRRVLAGLRTVFCDQPLEPGRFDELVAAGGRYARQLRAGELVS